jgi:type VI secretion system protein ImpE
MSAKEHFQAGRLAEAVQAQTAAVKSDPADTRKRTFFFELLAFAGDLERAGKQLDALRHNEPERDATTAMYRKLLAVEQLRRKLFTEGLRPNFLAPPPEHLALRLGALDHLRTGDTAKAAELLQRAMTLTPEVRGLLNNAAFTGLTDGDDRFGGVLEVMSEHRYFWVPLEQIDVLACNPPSSPRDLLWAPAQLEVHNGAQGGVFLPALYPGSHEHAEEGVKLGRVTEWLPLTENLYRGVGAHTFHVGTDQEMGLLDLRMLVVEHPDEAPAPAKAEGPAQA